MEEDTPPRAYLGFIATVDYKPFQTGRPAKNKSAKLYPTAGAAWSALDSGLSFDKTIRKVFAVSYRGVFEVDWKGERKR